MKQTQDAVLDVSEQYHLWDELVTAGIRTALAGSGEEPDASPMARQRLSRGLALALEERDEMWRRLLRPRNAADP